YIWTPTTARRLSSLLGLAQRDLDLLGFTRRVLVGQRDFVAGRLVSHGGDQRVGAVDGAVVDLGDHHVARHTGGRCGAVRHPLDNLGAGRFLVAGDLHAQRGVLRGNGNDQLVGDALGLMDRNRKAETNRAALRVG